MCFKHTLLTAMIILAAIFIAGCAATKTVGGESESGLILQYRLPERETVKYDFQSTTIQKMEVMGQHMEIDIRSAMLFSMDSHGTEAGVNEAKVTIDSMFLSLKSPQGQLTPDMKNVIGKDFTLRLSATGKELETKGAESIEYELVPGQKQNATNLFQVLFPDLAGKPVKVGDTWISRDTIRQSSSAGTVTIALESENTLAAIETFQGRSCAKIQSNFKGPLHSEETQGPMNIVTNGTMKGSDLIHFAYEEGLVVSVVTTATVDAVAEGTGPQSITIPLKREMKNELHLVAAPPAK